MRTTIDVSDSLLAEAKREAARRGTTLREIFEDGLRTAIGKGRGAQTFRLREAAFRGRGLKADVDGGSWEGVRKRLYEGRGE